MCGKYYADREFIPKLSTLFKEEDIYPDSELRREWESVLSDESVLAEGKVMAEEKVLAEGKVVAEENVVAEGRNVAEGKDMAARKVAAEGRKDISPTDSAVVIFSSGGRLTASNMEWGFRDPYHNTLVINARAESVFDKQMFADSIRARRCVIPASGYYEWDSAKAKYSFKVPDGGLTLLAGIYRLELGEPHYTVLTTEANECMKPVHTRMPITINQDEIKPWLTDDASVSDYLERIPEELERNQDSGQITMDLGI